MHKRLFVLLVILMSLSLIGIIFVQGYWIKKSVEDKEEQFSNSVSEVLSRVTEKITSRERKDYFDRYINIKDSVGDLKSSHFKNFFYVDSDSDSDEILYYSHGILEEEYNIASTFFDNGNSEDTTTIKNYTSKRTKAIFKQNLGLDGRQSRLTPIEKIEKIGGLTSMEVSAFEDMFGELAKRVPIHNRVSKQEIELLLERELSNRNIDTDYEYGIA
ncbi:MAG: two-component sensor histidine kinase, partial [Maribacter sp.]